MKFSEGEHLAYLPRLDRWVSNLGRVFKAENGELCLCHQTSSRNYKVVQVKIDGVWRNRLVHRLVLEAFRRPPQRGEVGRHINDEPLDNRLTNLAWGTRYDNAQDARRNGGIPQGEARAGSKLTESDVLEIRQRYANGRLTQRELAEEYGVDPSRISHVVNNKGWLHVA
jgi:predicted XRE-type DNA-binding protein